jgi:ADP-ribose pyrophosphatase
MSAHPHKPRILTHQRLYSGKVIDLDLDEIEEPGGVHARREVVRQHGSVAALPVHDDGRVTLVRQYRYAVDALVWELPAGRIDGDEAPEDGARRELEEEVGLRPRFLEPLLTFWTTPGFCDEVMHLFRATGLVAVPPRPEEDERIEVGVFTLQQADAMVRHGEIREGKTLVALLLELQRRSD